MNKKNVLICIDRDGTLVYDDKYHLGRQKNWKSLIKIFPGVISGMEKLSKIPHSTIYVITNQPGVAIKDFKLLTLKRAKQVTSEIIKRIKKDKKDKIKIGGSIVCAHASTSYVKKRSQYSYNRNRVGNFSCIKPNPGMVLSALKKQKWTKKNTEIYVLGDRASDVQTAKNANGFGIFIPFKNRPGEKKLVKKVKYKNSYIAKNFLDATKFILKREGSH